MQNWNIYRAIHDHEILFIACSIKKIHNEVIQWLHPTSEKKIDKYLFKLTLPD